MQHINTLPLKTKPKNTLLQALYLFTSKGRTANDAITFTRSGSSLLDFYAQAGAMREQPKQALNLFQKAFAEDREKAIRILFYLRDIRGGQGERALFRFCLEWLGTRFPDIFAKIIHYVPEYGRWDDLFFDNEQCLSFIQSQLNKDKNTETPSLLAKWLPTINASSPKTKAKAKFLAQKLGMRDKDYRQLVRQLRKKIATVEEQMSARKWEDIHYSHVPSQASRIYRHAFKRHDKTRYTTFVEQAKQGKVRINTSTLYPYQIYKSVLNDYSQTLEALWVQLPDYTQGKNAIVVADVSGSMMGDPLLVSVSLALYFAQRNKGQFKDHFITFSENPTLQRIKGDSLVEKTHSIATAEWGMNTNLQAVFDLLLTQAIQYQIPQHELPETVYIISDMEFDSCCTTHTNMELIQRKYQQSGYKIPTLVFWNVRASGKNLPVQKNAQNITLVSGLSPSIFSIAVENKSPEQVMNETINSERYAQIVIA